MKIAILSDIHANLHALQMCLNDLERLRVDQILGLGDLVGYGPDPNEVIRLVQSVGINSVMGNHDYAVNAVYAEKWFNPQAKTAVAITRRLLSDGALDYLRSLPITMTHGQILFVHGFPPNSFKTYLYMVPEKGIKRVLNSLSYEIVLVGHTHELFLYTLSDGSNLHISPLKQGIIELKPGKKYIINAGSVGQPRDGDPRAKYCVLDTSNFTLETRFVEYDWKKVAKRIIDRGLPETYAKRLMGR